MGLETFLNTQQKLNNMELFLSGGGIGTDSKEIDDLFANSVDKSKPLLYIPIAINQTKRPYTSCFKFISDVFNPRGIKDIVMWTEKDIANNAFNIDTFGGIYVGGGNTFYLLKRLKETNFDVKLIKAIKRGIPYYGGSAGAIICGKSILPASLSDKNQVKLTDLKGFDLLDKYSISCHYKTEKFEKIRELQQYNKLHIIALPEDCGIYCKDTKIKVIGYSPAYIFQNKLLKIQSNSMIKNV
ncbi:peptidase E [Candidatus Woesearchaeota archaeon]|nr:peptidase E [Candidatus Woesearchaeota archaeon]